MDSDYDDPWAVAERDLPLSYDFHVLFQCGVLERLLAIGLPRLKNAQWTAVQLSILAQAVQAYETRKWISYSRNRNFYRGPKRYNGLPFNFERVVNAIDQAAEHGLLESRIEKTQSDRQSTFRATAKLVGLFVDVNYEFLYGDVIRLRARQEDLDRDKALAEGKPWPPPKPKNASKPKHSMYGKKRRKAPAFLVDYDDTPDTIRMRAEITKINTFLATVELRWPALFDQENEHVKRIGQYVMFEDKCVLVTDLRVYRSFSRNSFEFGGRIYGWWQGQKKDVRPQLLLNGEGVVEPDYSSYHATMLYAMKGVQLESDPYIVPGFSREEGKIAFNVMINANGAASANLAMVGALRKAWIPTGISRCAALRKAMVKAHPLVKEFLASDVGVKLMRKDSDIIVAVMLRLVEESIPFLPVHDSIICRRSDSDRVRLIMAESFSQAFPGFVCKVK